MKTPGPTVVMPFESRSLFIVVRFLIDNLVVINRFVVMYLFYRLTSAVKPKNIPAVRLVNELPASALPC